VTLQDDLTSSAKRWASAALDAYSQTPPDLEFAVHHMAVAVEHLSKAYLCSISEALLIADKPSLDDLLLLAGRPDKTAKRHVDVRTISAEGAIVRAEQLLTTKFPGAQQLKLLRETRNGVTHLGLAADVAATKSLLAAGVQYADLLLAELMQDRSEFWSERSGVVQDLVDQAVDELKLRVREKIRRAKDLFESRFGDLREEVRQNQIAELSKAPVRSKWLLAMPMPCPACGSPALASGREYDEYEVGSWFVPRFFGCRVCELRLAEDELEEAGIEHIVYGNHEQYDEDWEPDPEDLEEMRLQALEEEREPDPEELEEIQQGHLGENRGPDDY